MSMKTAAIYARVSSDQQKEDKTIASQTAALVAFASSHGYGVPDEWIFEDEGFSGATLVRPGLERVRDLVEVGAYRKGADARVDQAIIAYPKIIEFLKQEIGAVSTRSDSLAQLLQAVGPAAAVPRG